MNEHPAVIEAGPVGVRRLCCGTSYAGVLAGEAAQAALEAIDDAVTLVNDQPVATQTLWSTVLRSLIEKRHTSVVVVHPSWWSAARVAVVRRAATDVVDSVVLQRRSELLVQAAPAHRSKSVVEITERFVAVSGAVTAAERCDGQPQTVAERIARVVETTSDTVGTVLIDAPAAISGAGELATAIIDRIRTARPDLDVIELDGDDVCRLAAAVFPHLNTLAKPPAISVSPSQDRTPRAGRRRLLLSVGVVVVAALLLGASLLNRRTAPPSDEMPTAFLVEGRIALTVPSQWSTRRVVDGPGSPRVQVSSPADPEIALHVTQSAVADQTLSETAEALKRAIDADASGVFVDFNPSGRSAGRPAVTYREVRPTHDVQWSVLLDGAVRISIGCQSRRGAEAAIRAVCELAVRSARTLK